MVRLLERPKRSKRTPRGVAWEMTPAGRSSGSRRWPPFIPSRVCPSGLYERRVAHSCRAAPVSHRIPVHLPAVSAADAPAASFYEVANAARAQPTRAFAPSVFSNNPRLWRNSALGDFGCDDAQDTTHLPFREDVTGHKAAAGRSPGFRIFLLTAPSRRVAPVVMAAFVPGHSGGSAPDSHRLPGLSPRKPTCDTSEKRFKLNQSLRCSRGGIKPPRTCRA